MDTWKEIITWFFLIMLADLVAEFVIIRYQSFRKKKLRLIKCVSCTRVTRTVDTPDGRLCKKCRDAMRIAEKKEENI